MAKFIIEGDINKGKTSVKGSFPEGHGVANDTEMGEVKHIDNVTIYYHKVDTAGRKCVTILLNGVPHRICSYYPEG